MIPEIFRRIPKVLSVVDPPSTAEEVRFADEIRRKFVIPGEPAPYMIDVVRAFRLVCGAQNYVEVGTRDKGNLAWVSHLLAPNPLVIDLDIERYPSAEASLVQYLSGKARYHFIQGDSVAPQTVSAVRDLLGGAGADAIFCDSSHLYDHALAEFEAYWPLVRPGGVLMFHDALWEGNASTKGKCQAFRALDHFIPVWLVVMNEPVHRFLPSGNKTEVWGTVAIIVKE